MSNVVRPGSLFWIVATALSISACTQPGSAPGGASDQGGTVGSIAVALDVAPAETVGVVGYTINGPAGFVRTGTFDVSHSTTISGTVGGLPAGNGFTIALSATSASGAVSCTGSGAFNVTAHATNTVTVHLACKEAPRMGSVTVTGTLDICPVVDGVAANPSEAIVGTGIRLTGSAHDSDAGPAPKWRPSWTISRTPYSPLVLNATAPEPWNAGRWFG